MSNTRVTGMVITKVAGISHEIRRFRDNEFWRKTLARPEKTEIKTSWGFCSEKLFGTCSDLTAVG